MRTDTRRSASINEHALAIGEVRYELGEARKVCIALGHMRRKIDPITLRCHDLALLSQLHERVILTVHRAMSSKPRLTLWPRSNDYLLNSAVVLRGSLWGNSRTS
jgi:hypothetical protein